MWKAPKGKLGWWSFEISAACIFDYSVTAVAEALPLLRDLPQLRHTCGLWSEPLMQRGTSTWVIGCHSNRYWEVMDSPEAEDVMDYGTTLPHSLLLSLWMPRWISQLMRQCPPQVMELCVGANRGMPFGSSVHSDEFPALWPFEDPFLLAHYLGINYIKHLGSMKPQRRPISGWSCMTPVLQELAAFPPFQPVSSSLYCQLDFNKWTSAMTPIIHKK